jgi:hypothetical protein
MMDDSSSTSARTHRSVKPNDYLYFAFLLHMAYESIGLQAPNRNIEFVAPHGNERHHHDHHHHQHHHNHHHILRHLDLMARLKRKFQQAKAIFSIGYHWEVC